ncbi:hypothetical protein SGGBAA2069_c00420 [Streptococcus gallolyticus subsp. gallolyticus ATCC BAA-2069]|nr:hypothetical protein SGGBAA2069_c00420 [Streptococcus gallolyticus subsp. gallolyticus ATCC BAA-2069]
MTIIEKSTRTGALVSYFPQRESTPAIEIQTLAKTS